MYYILIYLMALIARRLCSLEVYSHFVLGINALHYLDAQPPYSIVIPSCFLAALVHIITTPSLCPGQGGWLRLALWLPAIIGQVYDDTNGVTSIGCLMISCGEFSLFSLPCLCHKMRKVIRVIKARPPMIPTGEPLLPKDCDMGGIGVEPELGTRFDCMMLVTGPTGRL